MLQVPIYVINLVDRPERLKYIDYNFKKYNLKYNVVSVEKPLDKGKFKYIGERGCFYSHIKILEQALNKSDDIFIIAEDDAHLTDKFSYLFDTYIEMFRNSEYDMMHFYDYDAREINDVCLINSSTHYAHFYAVKRSSIRNILNIASNNHTLPIDNMYVIAHNNKQIKMCITSQLLVKQNRIFESDIAPLSDRQHNRGVITNFLLEEDHITDEVFKGKWVIRKGIDTFPIEFLDKGHINFINNGRWTIRNNNIVIYTTDFARWYKFNLNNNKGIYEGLAWDGEYITMNNETAINEVSSGDFSIRVLYLHHKNDNITKQNYESFVINGNKITAIRDADATGLDGSIPIPVTNMPIPRGNRYWDSDTPSLNYFLMNHENIKETHILLCEWDCHCRCNLEHYLSKYKDNDVTVPHIVTTKNDPKWDKFNNLLKANISNPIGFQPSTFMLFKKEPLKKLCEYISKNWNILRQTNSEGRVGTAALLNDIKYREYDIEISKQTRWHPTKFTTPNSIYHPVKTDIINKYFNPEDQPDTFVDRWDFGPVGGIKYGTLILNKNGIVTGYDNFNETFWKECDGNLELRNGNYDITTLFSKQNMAEYWCGDFYDGRKWTKNRHWLKRNTERIKIEHVNVDSTYRCTLSCSECDRNIPAFKHNSIPDLEYDKFVADFTKIRKVLDINWLQFEGGEPLLHKDLIKMVKATKELNFARNVLITTNATTINLFTEDLMNIIDGVRISVYKNVVDDIKLRDFIYKLKSKNLYVDVRVMTTFDKCFSKDKINEINLKNCWQHKNCYQYTFGYFFNCTSAYSINTLIDGKIIDGINVDDEDAGSKIVKHVLYNNSYKACHNCHFSTKNERVEWTQTTPEEWKRNKGLI